MKLLFVDDNKGITDLFTTYFKSHGHDCYAVNDGKNGLSLLENEHFDLTVLDIAMPEFCGFDVLQKMYEEKKKQNIIVLTAVTLTDQEIILLKQYNVKQILKKPVNLKLLLHEIQNIS